MRALRVAVRLRLPLAAAVAGTLEKVDPRHRWQPAEVIHRQNERSIDQAMNGQPMFSRIDVRYARVVPFEVERRGRDDADGVLQRSAAGRRLHTRGLAAAAPRALLEPRAFAVGLIAAPSLRGCGVSAPASVGATIADAPAANPPRSMNCRRVSFFISTPAQRGRAHDTRTVAPEAASCGAANRPRNSRYGCACWAYNERPRSSRGAFYAQATDCRDGCGPDGVARRVTWSSGTS